ncbi:DNA polymerase III subunit gamma and tau [Streptomyces albidoflavus]|uniref:DNA polymerase III subunit gamma and tau n=8 Tax=Streptomyces TaxID=1883 RepID=UPI001F1BF52E|nr:DNA polymerase III subunit gamma and tau [Streptomyces albidoflavus]
MSSLALYRRYRPESFAEVIGQEHVTDPLQQALRNNRVNHAYLFSGPRGCGKTTSARILARCLNCEQGPTPDPCGTCQSCQDLARNGPGSIDVIEIDAASHGGVDDARDLREKAFFGPASSRYKIYIIDEAHMVTSAGFNALLKVVEEPPEHLKFIFATTEPEKVIGTIRSRTHHYPFRLVPPGTLREYLAEVCGKEGSRVEDGVLPLVVRAGAGSVRDSMSVMDQLLAGAGEDGVTYAMATALLGYTDGSLLDSVVDAFAAGDGAAAFEVVDRVVEGGNDPRRFVADLLERLRDLVILAAVPDAAEKGLIDAPADLVERMQAQASVFGAAELSRAADLVNEGLTEMRGATSPRLQLELICARVLLPAAYDDERSTLARLERLERSGPPAQAAAPLAPQAYAPAQPQVPQAPPAPAPTPAPQQSAPPAAAPDAPPPTRPGPPGRVARFGAARLRRARARRAPARRLADGRCRRRPRAAAGRAAGAGPPAGAAPAAGGPGHAPAGCGRRPCPVAERPGGGQEPPPLHLDPAQPERPRRRVRRHHAPARLPQRRRPGQLREQRQRGRTEAGARRGVPGQLEDRDGHRRLGRPGSRHPARRWRRRRLGPGPGPAAPGGARPGARARPAAARPGGASGPGARPAGAAGSAARAAAPGPRTAETHDLHRGRHPRGGRPGPRRVGALRPRPDHARAGRHGGGGIYERVAGRFSAARTGGVARPR